MNKYETLACEHFLSEFDFNLSYEAIKIQILDGDRDAVVIWEPFEYHNAEEVCDLMDNLRDSIMSQFKENAE